MWIRPSGETATCGCTASENADGVKFTGAPCAAMLTIITHQSATRTGKLIDGVPMRLGRSTVGDGVVEVEDRTREREQQDEEHQPALAPFGARAALRGSCDVGV